MVERSPKRKTAIFIVIGRFAYGLTVMALWPCLWPQLYQHRRRHILKRGKETPNI